jgi:hypothetical protein
MFPANIGGNFEPVAVRVANHALRPLAILQAEAVEVLAAKSELDCSEPKIPVFEAEFHAFVEPSTLLEERPSHQTARFADIFLQMSEHRVFPGEIAVPLLPEHVDIRVNPTDLRVLLQRVIRALQCPWENSVVGIEKVDRSDGFPSVEDILDPGVTGGAEPAVLPPNVMHPAGCAADEVETSLMRLRHRTAVVDDDDAAFKIRLLA